MRTVIIILFILVALYLLVWQSLGLWLLIKGFTKRERKSVDRWFLTISLLGLFGIATEWIMFWPAWWQRHKGKKSRLWWWMDDARFSDIRPSGLAEDFEVFLNGRKETIFLSYEWHMRNRIQNKYNKHSPTQTGKLRVVKMISDNLTMNGKKVDQTLSWAPMARLKYWKNIFDSEEGSHVNNGFAISKKYSIFGDGKFWYEDDDKTLFFRYSVLVKYNYLIFKGWRNIVMGTNARGYVSTIKHKRFKRII